tara:strand:+ start:629 stop:1609 length:981 start_codon:yes stop_codon:yes gene_type:complete
MATLSQHIKRIHANQIKQFYLLFGEDFYLQNFFIEELKKVFLDGSGELINFSLSDRNEDLRNEVESRDLFAKKKIIFVANCERANNQKKTELPDLVNSGLADDVVIVAVFQDKFYKNSFFDKLKKSTDPIDVRTPPPWKKDVMQSWIKYFCKKEKIMITPDIINSYIDAYGDSLANVMNEIEKSFLFFNGSLIDSVKMIQNDSVFSTHQELWNFLDAIGKKDIVKAITCYNDLSGRGFYFTIMVNRLFFLFQSIFFSKLDSSNKTKMMFNKIIQNNFAIYTKTYSYKELTKIFSYLNKIEVLSKTTSVSQRSLFFIFMVNCLYEQK